MRPRSRGFDRQGAEVAARHRIDAQTVADVVQAHDLGEIDDLAQAAENVDRLVLGALDHEPLVAPLEHATGLTHFKTQGGQTSD